MQCLSSICVQVDWLDVSPGGHTLYKLSKPKGVKVMFVDHKYADHENKAPLMLLHYGTGLGPLEYRLSRFATIKTRIQNNDWMSKFNLGKQYIDDGKLISDRYQKLKQMAKDIPGVSSRQCRRL